MKRKFFLIAVLVVSLAYFGKAYVKPGGPCGTVACESSSDRMCLIDDTWFPYYSALVVPCQ